MKAYFVYILLLASLALGYSACTESEKEDVVPTAEDATTEQTNTEQTDTEQTELPAGQGKATGCMLERRAAYKRANPPSRGERHQ